MNGWIYTHNINPILAEIGPLRLGWYGLMYAVGFLVWYRATIRYARKPGAALNEEEVGLFLTYGILGVVLGGRLGYVLFYGGAEYWQEPWRILQTWKGGMSFHGGVLGVTLAVWLFARRHQKPLLDVADFTITWIPAGLLFGRIGNFINGELYGKPTSGTWGVVFPGDPLGVPRHPSQLYEALLEGLIILVVLVALRKRFADRRGLQPAAFLVLYSLSRMAVELVRLPDVQLGYLAGGFVTMGQILSLPMLLAGLGWVGWIFSKTPEPGK
ncbi:MAG: prolipoprotein diacylglyceryl transferase [Deltaproteobacteria bacterium]|nr:prolipoprotein diacylglyceryl transferase [Deltaproteobacteria bacterium]